MNVESVEGQLHDVGHVTGQPLVVERTDVDGSQLGDPDHELRSPLPVPPLEVPAEPVGPDRLGAAPDAALDHLRCRLVRVQGGTPGPPGAVTQTASADREEMPSRP